MTTIVLVAVIGVALCWVVTANTIWKWGPGLRKRLVRCPEKKSWAMVKADHREAEFASLHVVDITACSLIAASPLNCSKQCISRL